MIQTSPFFLQRDAAFFYAVFVLFKEKVYKEKDNCLVGCNKTSI